MIPLSLLLRVKTVVIGQWWLNFFPQKMDFRWMLQEIITELIALLNLVSFIGLSCVSEQKKGIRTNPPIAYQILCNCLRKGCLLRFQSNCIATSDGPVQKLGNSPWNDSESIVANFCSQWCLKAMLEAGLTGQASIFNSKTFWAMLSNLLLKIIIYWVIDQPF